MFVFILERLLKSSYNGGRGISPSGQSYTFVNPAQAMPRIVSTNGSNNIAAIKNIILQMNN